MTDNNEETFAFQAEISQLMSLIINTFYSNKDIFLRELISNSSDALDKIRYQSLTNSEVLDSENSLHIHVVPDLDNNVLNIIDTGIGMTRDDLINNLGTIAKSGTKSFMQAITEGADLSMIGQFGVGFYSAYLVADNVRVISKHNDSDSTYEWESSASGSFIVRKSDVQLTRGTQLVLHLKDDMKDYLQESKIRDIITKHSQFINYPISLSCQKERQVEVEDNVDNENNEDEPKEGDITEVDENKETEKKTRTETYNDFEELNKTKPIWINDPKEVSDEQYQAFYNALTNSSEEYSSHKHFKVEGNLEFRSILYLPKRPPMEMFSNNTTTKHNLKLYVRRVLISEECGELVPEYLNFVKGVVDSEDLPLNVSREMLQQSRILKTMKKNIVKKCIEMFEELSENEEAFLEFYQFYSKNIKLGIHEDSNNRQRLAKLLRYMSTNDNKKATSLDEYISRMKENQQDIYYITGENLDAMAGNTLVCGLLDRGFEVILMNEPIDEYCVQQLNEYDGKKLVCITKEGLELPRLEEEQKIMDERIEVYKPVCEKIKELLGDQVEKVYISDRLFTDPCSITTSQYGWSANMERIMKAQALGDNIHLGQMMSKKNFEINPGHPIINEIKTKILSSNENEMAGVKDLLVLMYETALLNSGFTLNNPVDFSSKMNNLIMAGLGIPFPEPSMESKVNPNEPVANEPVANEPVANEPVANETVANEPVAVEPVAVEPVANEPVALETVAEETHEDIDSSQQTTENTQESEPVSEVNSNEN
jgi:molecular chaperone HtpG